MTLKKKTGISDRVRVGVQMKSPSMKTFHGKGGYGYFLEKDINITTIVNSTLILYNSRKFLPFWLLPLIISF